MWISSQLTRKDKTIYNSIDAIRREALLSVLLGSARIWDFSNNLTNIVQMYFQNWRNFHHHHHRLVRQLRSMSSNKLYKARTPLFLSQLHLYLPVTKTGTKPRRGSDPPEFQCMQWKSIDSLFVWEIHYRRFHILRTLTVAQLYMIASLDPVHYCINQHLELPVR